MYGSHVLDQAWTKYQNPDSATFRQMICVPSGTVVCIRYICLLEPASKKCVPDSLKQACQRNQTQNGVRRVTVPPQCPIRINSLAEAGKTVVI